MDKVSSCVNEASNPHLTAETLVRCTRGGSMHQRFEATLSYPVHPLTELTMGFAIVTSGGKQYRVQPGDIIEVEKLDGVESGPLTLREILMVKDDDGIRVGQPTIEGATVEATVLGSVRANKIQVFTYHAKKRHRRRLGHRQTLTRIRIESIGPPSELSTSIEKTMDTTKATASGKAKAKAAAKPKRVSKDVASASPTVAKPTTDSATKAKAKPQVTAKNKTRAKPKAKAKPKSKAKPKASSKPNSDVS